MTSSASPCSSTTMARPSGGSGACCAGQDIHDARRVADRLGIPHYVLDYEQRFKATVMQSFADSYAAGETPIPCVTCNQQIKFQRAAGHRPGARRRRCWPPATTSSCAHGPAGPRALSRPRCRARPELFPVRHHAARSSPPCCFPLGAYAQGRGARAGARARLPVADKSDSQDICFVPQGRYTERHRAPEARRRGGRRHRARGRPRARPPRRASSTTRSASAGGSASPAARRCTSCASMPRNRRSWSGRARACTRTGSAAGRQLAGRRARSPQTGLRRGRARSARRRRHSPRPCSPCGENAKVLLRDGEYGIAAGQACVFYADAGPERVCWAAAGSSAP